MPILKQEPEIFPPDLFGGKGENDRIVVPSGIAADDVVGHLNGHTNGGMNGHNNGHPNTHLNGHHAGTHRANGGNGNTLGLSAPWWVAHVRSRQEKKLSRHLLDQEVPYYLPMRQQRTRRPGERRHSFLPLFPGYLFFRATAEQRLKALQSNLMVNLLAVDDQGLLASELRALWELQRSGNRLVPHPYIGVGDPVEIVEGPFKGYRGTVLRKKGRYRLVVSLTLLRKSVAAELDREALAPCRQGALGFGSPSATAHRRAPGASRAARAVG